MFYILIDYNTTTHGARTVKENKGICYRNTPQSVKQQLNETMLDLVSKIGNEKFASSLIIMKT